jgi:hypothetical protein
MIALASLSESARKVALDRFRLLQPHLEQQRLLKLVARDAGIAYRTAHHESLVIGQTSMRLRFGSALRLLGSDSRKPSRVFRYWRQTFLENESFGSDRRIPGNVTKTSHASTSLRWLCALEDSESNDR